jgi:hypothetical protein
MIQVLAQTCTLSTKAAEAHMPAVGAPQEDRLVLGTLKTLHPLNTTSYIAAFEVCCPLALDCPLACPLACWLRCLLPSTAPLTITSGHSLAVLPSALAHSLCG